MEKVWEEASLVASRRTSIGDASSQSELEKQQEISASPAAPPLRGRFGKLWERASSLGAGVVEKISTAEAEKDRNEEDAKKLPSPPPEPEEPPPKRLVPPLPTTETQASVPPQLPPRNQNLAETTIPPAEGPTPPRSDSVLFDHNHHDHPQPMESSPEKPEPVVEKPKAPILPPRAPRHPPVDVVRPGTPSVIPLPDSRPSTPAPTTTVERRTSLPPTPTKLDPGRSSSPAPGVGGAPPPIPRRAPARVRPISVSLRPSTPLDQHPVNLPEEGKEETKELEADPPKTDNEVTDPVEETAPPPVDEVVTRPSPEALKPIFTQVEPRQPDAEIARNTEAPSLITIAEGTAASPVDTPHTTGDSSGLVNNQNLVGDKSWEDKTWREIVRLREEMFHARMGIVR
jgi:hypothetical protein